MNRIEKLKKVISDVPFLITNPVNVKYISGFTGSYGMCLITPKRFFLITDGRYKQQARNEVKNFEIKSSVIKTIKKLKIKKILIEADFVTLSEFENLKHELPDCEFVPKRDIVLNLRAIKSKEEIKKIKCAIEIAEMGFERVVSLVKPGVSEADISTEYEYYVRKAGAQGSAFKTIIASGIHSSMPHAQPTNKKLKNNEVIVIDFGVNYNGYNSDITRTIFLGKVSKKIKFIYNIVQKTVSRIEAIIKSEMKAKDIDTKARKILGRYEKYFVHSTGHGVGLEIHEKPVLNKKSKDILKSGMVFTIEPGIYISNRFGIRIEDIVTLTSDGCQVLTTIPKSPIFL